MRNRVCAAFPLYGKNLRKKVVLFYADKLHPFKSEGEIFTECLTLLKKYTQALGMKAAFRSERETAYFIFCLT